jgi:hypothetical protein
MAPHLPAPTRMSLLEKAQAQKEAWVARPNKAPFIAQRCKPFGVRHSSFVATRNAQN